MPTFPSRPSRARRPAAMFTRPAERRALAAAAVWLILSAALLLASR